MQSDGSVFCADGIFAYLIVKDTKGDRGVLVTKDNCCYDFCSTGCTNGSCTAFHAQPGSVVTNLPGRKPLVIGMADSNIRAHHDIQSSMYWSDRERAQQEEAHQTKMASLRAMAKRDALTKQQLQERQEEQAVREANGLPAVPVVPRITHTQEENELKITEQGYQLTRLYKEITTSRQRLAEFEHSGMEVVKAK